MALENERVGDPRDAGAGSKGRGRAPLSEGHLRSSEKRKSEWGVLPTRAAYEA